MTSRFHAPVHVVGSGLRRACFAQVMVLGMVLVLGLSLSLSLVLPAASALAAQPAAAAEPQALLTLLDGEATLIVGSRAYAAAPGARLGAGVLVETDAKTNLLRLEWPDGAVLDLGPATRVMLRPPPAARTRGAPKPLVYLLQGWAKQSQTASAPGQLSTAFDVQSINGVLVSQIDGATAVLFSETGDKQLSARRDNAPLALPAGQAAVVGSDGVAQVQARPPAGWLQRIPRAFRDTLPPRAAQFKSPPPALKARAALSYAALQPWLSAEPAVRRSFVTRFAELLRDREFRSSVDRHLAQHPEWEGALRPPRKPRPVPDASTDPEPTR